MQYHVTGAGTSLHEYLLACRAQLDWHCDGRGLCGRCQVGLLTGRWLCDGREVQAPAQALACQTTL
ncbi:MAG: 2Fe-2S iron-sulfur cluster binding domain-containing protein, partial [Victivallales bacterium]|nr:2Fe-2S iron-sulfur cluster binding domain-containing protein [Victivallales bacterium]